MTTDPITIALISDTFYDDSPALRLVNRLVEARALGADLAVLPELPVNPWSPATKNPRKEDAEAPEGPLARRQSEAARTAGIGLIGGVIEIHPNTHIRYNTALAFDKEGNLRGKHQKWHIPEEPGFWESSHYEEGIMPPTVVHGLGIPIGLQICSDLNRPEGSHLLAALGAEIIIAPRATELATYQKWRPVFQANAVTSGTYLVSVNRPATEQGVLLGGPSIAVAPNSDVILETTDVVSVVTIDREAVRQARIDYPGYLPVRAELYAKAWSAIAESRR